MMILGIETSCDETSVAITENGTIRANEIFSQIDLHATFGGVVPEIASRAHIQKIDHLAGVALRKAGVTLNEIDLIAVTDTPGLAGALLVGISFGLGLHQATGKPITGIHHLEGHICSVLFDHPSIQFPCIALVVSGGHTALYVVNDIGSYHCLGQTIDDAAGEAFDKVGKLLGFPYPAGRAIENEAHRFSGTSSLRFPIARIDGHPMDFSFSGLKTAVKNYLATQSPASIVQNKPEITRAFQNAVVGSLVAGATVAARETGINRVILVGGVACNGALRQGLREIFGDAVYFPKPGLCTDNAAMIARAAWERSKRNRLHLPRMEASRELAQES